MARKNDGRGFKPRAVVEFSRPRKRFLKHHEVCRVLRPKMTIRILLLLALYLMMMMASFATDYDTKK